MCIFAEKNSTYTVLPLKFSACCGKLSSLDFPSEYHPNATNIWRFEADNKTRIGINFEFVEVSLSIKQHIAISWLWLLHNNSIDRYYTV